MCFAYNIKKTREITAKCNPDFVPHVLNNKLFHNFESLIESCTSEIGGRKQIDR